MADLVVREWGTGDEIARIPVNNLTERSVDRVVRGMLLNMNREKYYVDDSEVTAAREAMKAPAPPPEEG